VSFVSRADQHGQLEVQRGRGNRQIVGRDQQTLAAERREQIGPPVSDGAVEVYDRAAGDESIDACSATGSASGGVSETNAHQELGVDDGRHDGHRRGVVAERPCELSS